jgi:hypothetical protein
LISAELLECTARPFSGNLCASRVASKPLHQSKRQLIKGFFVVRIKIELGWSGLKQLNGL